MQANEKMLKYLKSLKSLAQSSSLAEFTVVTGNQAADMDSCCSALLTAYLETELNQAQIVPLIPIPRGDMRLRRDIEYLFKSLGINTEWLLFADDEEKLQLSESTKLFLVDHNAPTLPGKVVSLIDHHEIENKQVDLTNADPNIIEKSGSCISNVVNYYAQKYGHATSSLFKNEPRLSPLAIGPILQDTNNFTKKVEKVDEEALKFLKEHLAAGAFSPFENFNVMHKEKKNLAGLSMYDLLRKDYKEWGPIGISSLPNLIQKLVKKGLQDLPNAMKRYQSRHNLEVVVALANGTNPRTDEYERQLVYCGPPDFDIAQECPDLELKLTSEIEDVRFYDQKNVAASRKQVAPALKAAYEKFKSQ